MHDPSTIAFDIKIRIGRDPRNGFPRHWYIATIWHDDPETDGSDDSCHWFQDGRPWWKHPRFHLRHLRVQIHFTQKLKRFLFSRCAGCYQRFEWGYAPVSLSWGGKKGPQWFESEENVYHYECLPRGRFGY